MELELALTPSEVSEALLAKFAKEHGMTLLEEIDALRDLANELETARLELVSTKKSIAGDLQDAESKLAKYGKYLKILSHMQ